MIVGWPGILTSLGLSIAGIVRQQPRLLLIAALAALPFAWYLNAAWPPFRGFGLFLPLFQLAAALALYRHHRWRAGVCLLPFVTIASVLAFIVLTQFNR